MTVLRKDAVRIGPHLHDVEGAQLQPGDPAPDFKLIGNDSRSVGLADFDGKVKLISVVPSLYTRVCDIQTRRFNQEAVALDDDVVVLTVSVDLPASQAAWCGSAGVERVTTLSDHLHLSFGKAYGTYVISTRQEQRSVFVIDRDNVVVYADYVPDFGMEPDYEKALEAAGGAVAASD